MRDVMDRTEELWRILGKEGEEKWMGEDKIREKGGRWPDLVGVDTTREEQERIGKEVE